MAFVCRADRAGARDKAMRQAQANADHFGVPFVIHIDTSGNYHCERQSNGPQDPSQYANLSLEVITPSKGS